MIVYYLMQLINLVGSALTSVFGSVFLLPWGIDAIFVTMVSYFRGAINTLPYLEVVLTCFLIAVGFEISLLVLKLIFGSRTPVNLN